MDTLSVKNSPLPEQVAAKPTDAPSAEAPPPADAPPSALHPPVAPRDADEAMPPPDWTPEQPHFNPMRENFCLAFLGSPNATRAAAFAGYSAKTARQQGCRLLKDPFVQMRLEELRLKHGVIYDVPRDTLLDRLELLFWQAVETNHLGVALGATAFQAKLAGHTMPGRFPPRPSTETLHLIAKMSSIYTARRMGQALAADEEQFAHGYSPRWRYSGKEVFDDPFEDIHRHYTEADDGASEVKRKKR